MTYLQAAVYAALVGQPRTARQIARVVGWGVPRVRECLDLLKRDGWVVCRPATPTEAGNQRPGTLLWMRADGASAEHHD